MSQLASRIDGSFSERDADPAFGISSQCSPRSESTNSSGRSSTLQIMRDSDRLLVVDKDALQVKSCVTPVIATCKSFLAVRSGFEWNQIDFRNLK